MYGFEEVKSDFSFNAMLKEYCSINSGSTFSSNIPSHRDNAVEISSDFFSDGRPQTPAHHMSCFSEIVISAMFFPFSVLNNRLCLCVVFDGCPSLPSINDFPFLISCFNAVKSPYKKVSQSIYNISSAG